MVGNKLNLAGILCNDSYAFTFSPQRTIICSGLLIVLVVYAPIIFDKFRKIEKPDIPQHLIKNFRNQSSILIDLGMTPRALIDLSQQFRVVDPYVIPRAKFLSNMPDTSVKLQGRFYLSNAVSYLGKPNHRQQREILIIPDSLMPPEKSTSPRYMLFRFHDAGFLGHLKNSQIADSVLWSH
jgi:hypothetical protein